MGAPRVCFMDRAKTNLIMRNNRNTTRSTKRKAGTVILYNPPSDVLDNIKSYIGFIEKLFVIDNSESLNLDLYKTLCRDKKIVYIFNHQNLGIARALNIAAELSAQEGFSLLLTMDQDARFPLNIIKTYINCLDKIEDLNEIAIISVSPRDLNYKLDQTFNYSFCEFHYTTLAITAGSWLNLYNYKKIGPFYEQLFIDGVDFDYCLRAIRMGYKIVRFPQIFVQVVGGSDSKRILNKKFALYPSTRLYYITRNNLYLWSKYFKVAPALMAKSIVFNLIFLSVNVVFGLRKFDNLRHIIKGFIHFFTKRFGKIS